MKKILITRPADVGKKMADRLTDQGFDCVMEPVLIPVRAQNVVYLDRHAEDGFVFTSPRAVEYFCDLSAKIDFAMPAYCVGPKTASRAKAAGFENVVEGKGGSRELAKMIIETAEGGARLIHPCGENVEDRFYETLKDAGFIIAPLCVYTMEVAPRMQEDALAEIRTEDISDVVFFSPRTARAFLQLANKHDVTEHLKQMRALCLSENVAASLNKNMWKDIGISNEKNEDSMVEYLCELKGK